MIPSHLSNDPTNKRALLLAFFIAGFAFTPAFASAAVQITEVMYDAPGGDTGHEWIEITNTGIQAVDLSTYKLNEANTNHKINSVSGGSLLAPGASAILSSDPVSFKSDWPSFAGILLKSAFSLSNTGETLMIKNASSSLEDIVSYTSSVGAAGDSGSLHRQGDSFVAALPTPGIYPGEIKAVPKAAPVVKAPAPAKTSSTKSSSTKSSSTKQPAAVAASEATFNLGAQSAPSLLMLYWTLGLVALAALGVAGALYARMASPATSLFGETKSKEEEFSIIDN